MNASSIDPQTTNQILPKEKCTITNASRPVNTNKIDSTESIFDRSDYFESNLFKNAGVPYMFARSRQHLSEEQIIEAYEKTLKSGDLKKVLGWKEVESGSESENELDNDLFNGPRLITSVEELNKIMEMSRNSVSYFPKRVKSNNPTTSSVKQKTISKTADIRHKKISKKSTVRKSTLVLNKTNDSSITTAVDNNHNNISKADSTTDEYLELTKTIETVVEPVGLDKNAVKDEVIENENIQSIIINPAPVKYKKFPYKQITSVSKSGDVDRICKEMDFVYDKSSNGKKAKVTYYRCRSIKKGIESKCPVRLKVVEYNSDTKFHIFKTDTEHIHNAMLKTNAMKDEICALRSKGLTAPMIISEMKKKHPDFDLKESQIYYMSSQLKEKSSNANDNTFGELKKWLSEFPTMDGPDDPILIGYDFDDQSTDLNAVFTTKRLISMAGKDIFSCKSTTNLNWEGNPITILGTFNDASKFHPIAIQISSKNQTNDFVYLFKLMAKAAKTIHNIDAAPKYLLSDNSETVKKAFEKSFTSEKGSVFVAHFSSVLAALNKFGYSNSAHKKQIIGDVKMMRRCANKKVFDALANLFVKKWSDLEPDLAQSFQVEWLQNQRNWYFGSCLIGPGGNWEHDLFEKTLKREHALRDQISFEDFAKNFSKAIISMSKQSHHRNLEAGKNNQSLTQILRAEAADIVTSSIFKLNQSVYYIVSDEEIAKGDSNIKTIKDAREIFNNTKFSSFDEFVSHNFERVHRIVITDKSLVGSTCTCSFYFTQKCCKHIYKVAIDSQLIPDTIRDDKPLVKRIKSSGRVARAKPALTFQK